MRNPFRTEADAFRLVLWVLVYLGAVALASQLGGRWVGLSVFIALTAVALAVLIRLRQPEPPVPTAVSPGAPGQWRVLVVANETLSGEALLEAVRHATARSGTQVFIVCPALNSHVRHWVSDQDDAHAAAGTRLAESLARLAAAGIAADGMVGDGDPLQAIDDVLRTRGADELIISTHPAGRSNWLERGVVEHARERFGLPTTHVVVDLSREHQPAGAAPSRV